MPCRRGASGTPCRPIRRPKSTIYDYLDLWDWDGALEHIHRTLYIAVREKAGRQASPTLAIIDAQSAKGAQNVWPAPSASAFS
jgi:hypothetical protein